MDSSNTGGTPQESSALQAENQRLRRELDDLRAETFASIRDREIQRQSEIYALQESHDSEIRRLTAQFDEELKLSGAMIEASGAETEVKIAREQWGKETQLLLDRATEEWADAERKRIAKIKVDMNMQRRSALEERDAYWETEIARIGPGSTPRAETSVPVARRLRSANTAKDEFTPELIPHPGTLLILLGIFMFVAASYLFAPQWQPLAKTVLQPALADLDIEARNKVYSWAPWLKPPAKTGAVSNTPVGYIRTRLANLRAAPSLNAAVVRVVDRGAPVVLVEETESWMKVELPSAENERLGWIHKSVLARSVK